MPADGPLVAGGLSVALIHNLKFGGARRVAEEHMRRLPFAMTEFCLETATAVSADPVVIPYRPYASRLSRSLRPPVRYTDVAGLAWAWARLAREVTESGADVILAHPCQFLQAPIALMWTRLPSVYFCHETRRVDYDPMAFASRNARTQGVYKPLYRAQKMLDRRAVRSARVLLANSHYSEGEILRAYGRRSLVVQLGVPDHLFAGEPGDALRHVLTVGSLIPSKGHDLAIEAVAASGISLPIVIVSPRREPVEEERLRAIAVRHNVRLEMRFGIPDHELRRLYQEALATLYLASHEPFGLASIEAQVCGTPVIVSDDGGLRETVCDGETGWCVPRQPSIAGATLRMLLDAERRRRMGVAAADWGRRFTWTEAIPQLTSVLEDVATPRDAAL
jgi:glycosyltransferase involved in cell wall biosynthesis